VQLDDDDRVPGAGRVHQPGYPIAGLLAALGEVGCLLAALLVLPAILLWRERGLPTSVGAPTTAEEERAT